MRVLTSVLWIVVTVAFGFDAVAQPCDLRPAMQTVSAYAEMTEMPCHDAMMANADVDQPSDAPMHMQDDCCCAALLTQALRVDGSGLEQPVPSVLVWADPLPDNARSIMFEYEPPPPRA